MDNLPKRNLLIGCYVSVLIALSLGASAVPVLIRHGVPLTHSFILREETVEMALIATLFVISILIMRNFMRALDRDQCLIDRVGQEKSRLASRLADAFNYIGTVNVELQEIDTMLCGEARYPENRREFKALIDRLATQAMIIAGTDWLVVRTIERHSGHTLYEHAVARPRTRLPAATLGNRDILDDRRVAGLRTIVTCQCNLDSQTVFILPIGECNDVQTILLKALLNQLEMFLMLHHAGCLKPTSAGDHLGPVQEDA